MAKNNNLTDFLKDLAGALREKTNTEDLINPQDFVTSIQNIPEIDYSIEDALVSGPPAIYNNPRITTIRLYAFYGSSYLTSCDFPSVSNIGLNAFYNCISLQSINIPNVMSIGNNGFRYCAGLLNITTPKLTSVGLSVFSNCTMLQSVDLTNASFIGQASFNACYNLTTVILRKSSSVTTLSYSVSGGSSAFLNCYHFFGTVDVTYNPQGLKDGYIYVPGNLINQYIVETNWVAMADRFRVLEDYTVDGTISGALDPTKI